MSLGTGSTAPSDLRPPDPPEAQGWVSLCLDGDPEARERLAGWAGRSAFGLALQLLRHRADAEDVAQEAVLRLFGAMSTLDSDRPVRPWLFRVVRNLVIDHSRRAKVRRGGSLDELLETQPALEPTDTQADSQRDLERRDLQLRLWRALAEVSEAHAEILVLRDYQDLSYKEISEVLSVPLGTVMSRLHAARRSLRERLLVDGPIHRGGLS